MIEPRPLMDQDDDHASFPPEWTLPELPKGPGPPLLSTQFEDIFCGGDVGTVPLIGLADDEDINKTLVQEGDSGTVDSGANRLISSIEETLELTPPPGGFDSVPDNSNQVRTLRTLRTLLLVVGFDFRF